MTRSTSHGKGLMFLVSVALLATSLSAGTALAQTTPIRGAEWDKIIEAAKKEGKVVVSLPASTELRAAIETNFEKRFGVDVEPIVGTAPVIVSRIVQESKAGIHYFDLHLGGSESVVNVLLPEGLLDPLPGWLVLPEVSDAKNWWGGHVWVDSAKRYIYASQAYQSQNLWYNAQSVKAEEVRSFDDLLDEKWKGKIGYLDPRVGGSGASLWSYLRDIKGEEYLRRLVGQNLLLQRSERQLAESLARNKISFLMGVTYYSFAQFVKAGLPVQPLPTPKEGLYVSGGSGNLVILKNAPHPNATKLFVNWVLSKEGQEVYSKGLAQATRRLDVDTKWLQDIGVLAAKDKLTLEQYHRLENQSEEKLRRLRDPAAALARKLLGQ
ncbi:MAG TPA: extracellular solute-binding protein [Candidatus Acidoferrales bacterium]|nr:extracellular solute-binding protein [Candidatus Acidoferrales bacterium]